MSSHLHWVAYDQRWRSSAEGPVLFFGANVQEAQIPGRSQVVALPPGSWTLPWMAPSLCRRLSASAGALALTLFCSGVFIGDDAAWSAARERECRECLCALCADACGAVSRLPELVARLEVELTCRTTPVLDSLARSGPKTGAREASPRVYPCLRDRRVVPQTNLCGES